MHTPRLMSLLTTLLLLVSSANCLSQNLPKSSIAPGLGTAKGTQPAAFEQSRPEGLLAPHKPAVPVCMAADLDASIQAAEGPDALYTLALNFRNISGRDCLLDQWRGLSLVPDVFPNGTRVPLCEDCLEQPPQRVHPIFAPLILQKDGIAHQAFSWKTEPADNDPPCLKPSWMAAWVGQDLQHTYLLACPALLKKVCSPVQYGNYVPGMFAENSAPSRRDGPNLELLNDAKAHFPGQKIELEGHASEPAALLPSSPQTCPVMLQRTRSPGGDTRWDWLGDQWCKREHSAGQPTGGQIALKFDAGQNSRWEGLGDHAISLIQVLTPVENGNVAMAESNTIHLNIADNTTLPRHWGPTLKGVAASIALDKHTYDLGEDIPLHVALENFSASVLVMGLTPLWDPGLAVAIEVRGACQYRIKRSGGNLYTGHGLWLPYQKGVLVPMEETLKGAGLLPAEPGAYTVTVSWCPSTCADSCSGGSGASSGPVTFQYRHYATVQDTEMFEVVDRSHPEGIGQHAEKPCFPPGFEQVETSLGPYTALLDRATGMTWLHLDLTAGRSYRDIKKNFAAGGDFEGWRYATPAELRRFFADFEDSADGYSTDRLIVPQLLKALGGPLASFSNPSTGWHRDTMQGLTDVPYDLGHAIYGLVMDDTSSGPVIDPKLQGSSRDDAVADSIGSYLVRGDR